MSDTPTPSTNSERPPIAPIDREQFWRDTFAASDLSVRAFCRQHGLHEKRFYTVASTAWCVSVLWTNC